MTFIKYLKNKSNEYKDLLTLLGLNDNSILIKSRKNGKEITNILIIYDENGKKKINIENFYTLCKDDLYEYFDTDLKQKYQKDPLYSNYFIKVKNYQALWEKLTKVYKEEGLIFDEGNVIYDIDFLQQDEIKFKIYQMQNKDENIIKITRNNVDFILDDENIEPKKYYRYLKLYKKVFPDFFEYINFLALNLFDAGRKTSYVYLNAPSDWGKSFLMGVFNELGIGLTVLPKSLEKRPSPLTPEMFRNKINLFIDEFKTFKHDYKMMTNSLQLESKNRNESTIPLFLKTFMSAEYSASFEDGVDDQIKNRVMIYKYKKGEVELLKDLLLKEKIIDKEFMKYIKVFIKRFLTKKVKYIRNNIDKIEIDKEINNIYKKNKLRVENLESKLLKIFLSEMYDLRERNNNREYPFEFNQDFDNKNQIIFLNDNIVRFTQLEKFVEGIIRNENKETQKKFEYKMRGEFYKEIFEYTTRRAGTNKLKYYKEIDLNYLEKKLELLERKENVSNEDEELKQINYLRKENLKLLNQISKLENELNEKKERIESHANEIKESKNQIADLQNQINKLYNNINNNSSESDNDFLLNEDEIPF
jgi:hypothetical protein